MASLTLRLEKGAPVTFAEMDSNMLALDSDSPWKVSDGHITYDGKVGLGYGVDSTYRPTYALDFGIGDSNQQVLIGSFADVQWHQDNATDFAIWTDTTERFVVSGTSGNVGIGVSVPNQPLDVVGNIQSTATVIGDQGFFQSVYDGQMTITSGSIFNGINADMTGTVTFGQLSDQTNTIIAFEIDEIVGSSIILPTSSAVKYTVDSHVAVLNARDDSEHAFNVRTHFSIDSESQYRDDSEHAWANANFDSEHNWSVQYGADIDSDAKARTDSDHAWAVNYFAGIDSALDSEHAWNVQEHTTLQNNIDSEHGYALSQINLLNARADSEHAYDVSENARIDAEIDSDHAWAVGRLDSDHLWASRNFDSEHQYAVDNFDSEHFWAKAYIESGDSALDSQINQAVADINASLDSEHAWNIAEHGQLQQNIDSRADSEHAWNVATHNTLQTTLQSNIDSDHAWANTYISTVDAASQSRDDSDHSWANTNFTAVNLRLDSEHAWNVAEHDSDRQDMLRRVDSDHQWALQFLTANAINIDSVYNALLSTSSGTGLQQVTDIGNVTTNDIKVGNLVSTGIRDSAGATALTIAASGAATFTGNVTGNSFIKSGGLATEFLMADGSVITEGSITAGDVANAVTFNNGGSGVASGTTYNGSVARTVSYNTVGAPSTTGTGASGTWGISVTGNSATTTQLATARTIGGVSFNGTANINLPGVNTAGNQNTSGQAGSVANAVTFNNGGSGAASGTTYNGGTARTVSYNTVGAPSTTGAGASGSWGISITGNSATTTQLATARTIGGVSFNGTANINLPGVNTAGNQNTSGNAATATAITAANTVTEAEGLASSDNDTSYPTTAAVIDYISSLGGGGTVTSVTAGAGMTQSGTNTINPTLDVVSANTGITVNADNINLNADQRGIITQFGANTSNYIVSTTSNISFFVEGNEDFKMFGASAGATLASEFHAAADIVAFSTSIASDEKFKTSIYTIQDALEKVKKLRGVNYTWKAETKKSGVSEIGVIAQEVQAVIPQVVKEVPTLSKEGETHLTVDYSKLVGLLIEAVKDLSDKVEKLESKK
jgi:hypothetical protein